MAVVSTAEVWIAYLDPVVGHEQGGRRPVVIVSNQRLHEIPSALVFVVPFTTRDRRVESHVLVQLEIGVLPRQSFAMTEQLRSISRQRLRKRIGTVDQLTMDLIRQQLTWFLKPRTNFLLQ
jgi:mRNA interferase MazF